MDGTTTTLLLAAVALLLAGAAIQWRMTAKAGNRWQRYPALVGIAISALVLGIHGAASGTRDHDTPCVMVLPPLLLLGLFYFVTSIATLREAERKRRTREAVQQINECLVGLGTEPEANMRRIVRLAGRLMGASWATYLRDTRTERQLYTWNAPAEMASNSKPSDAFLLENMVRGSDVVAIEDIDAPESGVSDARGAKYGVVSYVGKAVFCSAGPVGVLSFFFRERFTPTSDEKNLIGLLAAALGGEEERALDRRRLRVATEQYERFYQNARIGLVLARASDGRIVQCNRRFAEIYGYDTPRECISEVTIPTNYPERGTELEVSQLRRGGERFWILSWGRLLSDHGLVEAAVTDITDQKRAQDELSRERSFLDGIVDHAPYGMALFTPEGYFLRCNSARNALFGSAPRHGEGLFDDPFLVEAGVRKEDLDMLEGESMVLPPTWYGAGDEFPDAPETPVCVRVTLFPVKDDQGAVVLLVAMYEDLTEQVAAEEALRESTEKYQRLYNNAQVGLLVARSSDGKLLECIERLAHMHGYPTREAYLAHMSFAELYEDPDEADAALASLFERGTLDGEWQLRHRDGSVFYARVSSRLLRDTGLIEAVVSDITEQKEAAEAVALLAAAIEQAAEVVIITDVNGVVQYANPAFDQTTGYGESEITGARPSLLKSGRHNDAFYQEMWETILGGNVWTGNVTNRRKDGVIYEEELTISPVRDTKGEIVNFVGVMRDVTIESAAPAGAATRSNRPARGRRGARL